MESGGLAGGDGCGALDMESVLVLGDRQVLGAVFETFGQVAAPYYKIRFNARTELPDGVVNGIEVFTTDALAKWVNPTELYTKGYDTSNLYDEETVHRDEFSDDEQERAARRKRRKVSHRAGAPQRRRKQAAPHHHPSTLPLRTARNAPAAQAQGAMHYSPAAPPGQGMSTPIHHPHPAWIPPHHPAWPAPQPPYAIHMPPPHPFGMPPAPYPHRGIHTAPGAAQAQHAYPPHPDLFPRMPQRNALPGPGGHPTGQHATHAPPDMPYPPATAHMHNQPYPPQRAGPWREEHAQEPYGHPGAYGQGGAFAQAGAYGQGGAYGEDARGWPPRQG